MLFLYFIFIMTFSHDTRCYVIYKVMILDAALQGMYIYFLQISYGKEMVSQCY